jgi:hypothetical protein
MPEELTFLGQSFSEPQKNLDIQIRRTTKSPTPPSPTPFIAATAAKMTKRTKKVGVTGKYGTRYVPNAPDKSILEACDRGKS